MNRLYNIKEALLDIDKITKDQLFYNIVKNRLDKGLVSYVDDLNQITNSLLKSDIDIIKKI